MVDNDDKIPGKNPKNTGKNALPGEGSYLACYSRPLLVYTIILTSLTNEEVVVRSKPSEKQLLTCRVEVIWNGAQVGGVGKIGNVYLVICETEFLSML